MAKTADLEVKVKSDQLQETVDQLSELLTQGHTLLKDMVRERKRIEKLLKTSETHIELYCEKSVQEILAAVVDVSIREMVDQVGQTQRQLEEKVIEAMKELTNAMMYGNTQGRGVNLLEQALRARENRD